MGAIGRAGGREKSRATRERLPQAYRTAAVPPPVLSTETLRPTHPSLVPFRAVRRFEGSSIERSDRSPRAFFRDAPTGRGHHGSGRRLQRGFPARVEGHRRGQWGQRGRGRRTGGAAVGLRPWLGRGYQSRGDLGTVGRGRHSAEPCLDSNASNPARKA